MVSFSIATDPSENATTSSEPYTSSPPSIQTATTEQTGDDHLETISTTEKVVNPLLEIEENKGVIILMYT